MIWSKQEQQLLEENYANVTIEQLDRMLQNRTRYAIGHKARRLGLKKEMRYRKYKLDENFLDKWTRESAYFLGWVFSDGYIEFSSRRGIIRIAIKDLSILEKLQSFLSSNAPISREKPNKHRLSICSKYLCKRCLEIGLPRRLKDYSNFPKIPMEFLSHFIRGVFDGDGTIGLLKGSRFDVGYLIVGITSSREDFLYDLKVKTEIFGLEGSISSDRLLFSGNRAIQFCKLIYQNSENCRLERKYLVWKKVKDLDIHYFDQKEGQRLKQLKYKKIIGLFQEAKRPLRPIEIIEQLDINKNSCRAYIFELKQKGILRRLARGQYCLSTRIPSQQS